MAEGSYIISSNDTIYELHSPQHDQESHEGIYDLDSLRSPIHIAVPYRRCNVLDILRLLRCLA